MNLFANSELHCNVEHAARVLNSLDKVVIMKTLHLWVEW